MKKAPAVRANKRSAHTRPPGPLFGFLRASANRFPLIATLTILAMAPAPIQAQARSGIPEIDSLPLHDWSRSREPLSYAKAATLSALVPGAGQIYGHHPVRGGFLMGLETLLGGLAIYSNLVDIPNWRNQAKRALDSADILFREQGAATPAEAAELERRRREKITFARDRTQLAAQQEDLANSQMAWALGLHAYGVLDAVEIAYLSRHQDSESRSVRGAMYRGMLIPGWGQIYNRRYGKFGMLWMAIGASAASAASRQEMVDLLNDRLRTARRESGVGASAIGDLERDRTLYRKRRNQYYWGMGVFYMYAILDGMVDASLADFDAPERFAFTAGPGPMGSFACEWRLAF